MRVIRTTSAVHVWCKVNAVAAVVVHQVPAYSQVPGIILYLL